MGRIATQKWGWPVKVYLCGQKPNKINVLIEKIILSAGSDDYSTSKSCSKKWLRKLENDYETMAWLCCVIEKKPEHCIVSCIVLFAKNIKTGFMWNEALFICYWVK